MDVKVKLNDLKAKEDTMSHEDYVKARISIKAVTVNFDVIGHANGKGDDLQQIDGIDAGLEDKLNALGIATLDQLAKMTEDIADDVNEAIEYFPGRVKRQLWAEQARILTE
jgi:predicted flap endonuclease-1-like 5' DNA nuclease